VEFSKGADAATFQDVQLSSILSCSSRGWDVADVGAGQNFRDRLFERERAGRGCQKAGTTEFWIVTKKAACFLLQGAFPEREYL
jgi:hypothetical protein